MIREKDEEIYDLKSQLNDAKHFKVNNQQLNDALITDFKRTISVVYLFLVALMSYYLIWEPRSFFYSY